MEINSKRKKKPGLFVPNYTQQAAQHRGVLFCLKKKKKESTIKSVKNLLRDFPGGPVVKNPPANAGDTGSLPGPGRSHLLQAK